MLLAMCFTQPKRRITVCGSLIGASTLLRTELTFAFYTRVAAKEQGSQSPCAFSANAWERASQGDDDFRHLFQMAWEALKLGTLQNTSGHLE